MPKTRRTTAAGLRSQSSCSPPKSIDTIYTGFRTTEGLREVIAERSVYAAPLATRERLSCRIWSPGG